MENIFERFYKRPLSHSQISAFEYSPAKWYDSYVLGVKEPPNHEMLAGSRIGDLIGTPDSPIPDLTPPGVKEFEMRAEFEGMRLIGFADHYCTDTLVLHENKTSPNKSRWSKKKVDEHKQLTMYALLLNLKYDVEPEDIDMYINFIPLTIIGLDYQPLLNWRQFKTKRTKQDLEDYKKHIVRIVELMNEYDKQRSLSPAPRRAPVFNGV